jgi:hypothetical protein
MTQAHRGRRRGANFTVRVTDEERVILEEERTRIGGPKGLGPWLLWRALESRPLLGSSSSSGASAPAVGPELGVSERVILVVVPDGSACDRNTAAERAITPPGFARAFFEANP